MSKCQLWLVRPKSDGEESCGCSSCVGKLCDYKGAEVNVSGMTDGET